MANEVEAQQGKVDKSTHLKIPVLTGSYHDITVFDFSFIGIKIVDIEDDYVEEYIRNLSPENYDQCIGFILDIRKKIYTKFYKKYIIIKENIDDYEYETILNCWKLLLIIFPSDLQIEYIIYYENSNGFYQSILLESFYKRTTGESPGKLLMYREEHINDINKFIKLSFKRLEQNNYISIAIENYIQSYSASHYHYQFLTLLFCLECVIQQESELSYRLKRFISILCGEKPYNCNIIFQNISELYNIRSSIVHGGNMTKFQKNLFENLNVLQSIASQTIIELLIHNITDISLLNKKLTVLGYGERSKLSDDYQVFMLNIRTYESVNWNSLNPIKHEDPFIKWLSND